MGILDHFLPFDIINLTVLAMHGFQMIPIFVFYEPSHTNFVVRVIFGWVKKYLRNSLLETYQHFPLLSIHLKYFFHICTPPYFGCNGFIYAKDLRQKSIWDNPWFFIIFANSCLSDYQFKLWVEATLFMIVFASSKAHSSYLIYRIKSWKIIQ